MKRRGPYSYTDQLERLNELAAECNDGPLTRADIPTLAEVREAIDYYQEAISSREMLAYSETYGPADY